MCGPRKRARWPDAPSALRTRCRRIARDSRASGPCGECERQNSEASRRNHACAVTTCGTRRCNGSIQHPKAAAKSIVVRCPPTYRNPSVWSRNVCDVTTERQAGLPREPRAPVSGRKARSRSRARAREIACSWNPARTPIPTGGPLGLSAPYVRALSGDDASNLMKFDHVWMISQVRHVTDFAVY